VYKYVRRIITLFCCPTETNRMISHRTGHTTLLPVAAWVTRGGEHTGNLYYLYIQYRCDEFNLGSPSRMPAHYYRTYISPYKKIPHTNPDNPAPTPTSPNMPIPAKGREGERERERERDNVHIN